MKAEFSFAFVMNMIIFFINRNLMDLILRGNVNRFTSLFSVARGPSIPGSIVVSVTKAKYDNDVVTTTYNIPTI